jgi:hypothetical protein
MVPLLAICRRYFFAFFCCCELSCNFTQALLEWLVMFPIVLANFAQVLLQLWCCQSWHFYAGSARFVLLLVLAISRTHCWNCDVA